MMFDDCMVEGDRIISSWWCGSKPSSRVARHRDQRIFPQHSKKEEQFRTNQFSDPKLVQARIVLKQILYLAKPCFCFCGKGYV
jgi:hypothetical protein